MSCFCLSFNEAALIYVLLSCKGVFTNLLKLPYRHTKAIVSFFFLFTLTALPLDSGMLKSELLKRRSLWYITHLQLKRRISSRKFLWNMKGRICAVMTDF